MSSTRLLRPILAAVIAGLLGLGFGTVLLGGFSDSFGLRTLQVVAVLGTGLALVAGSASLLIVRLGGWRQGEEEFEQIVRRTERLAEDPDEDGWQEGWLEPADDEVVADDEAFARVLRTAINALPPEYHFALEHVEVVVVDSYDPVGQGIRRGITRPARYGAYEAQVSGDGGFPERIVLFRDLLIRDFGHDPDQLLNRLGRLLRRELGRRLRREPGLRQG